MRATTIIAALAALLLGACDAPAAAPRPTAAAPTAAPTAAPPPGTTPTAAPPTGAAPTAAPAAGLPAALYILEGGQIARIEPDGLSRAVITAEPAPLPGLEPITEFAVAGNTLAYIVSGAEADRLVLADGRGQGLATRYEQQGHELSDLVFTPDGQALMLRLLNNRQPPDLPSGLYRLPLAGGDPELIQADDLAADPVNPGRQVSGYRPVAFSPDGGRILLHIFSLYYEGCVPGVIAAAGGPVTRIALPEGQSGYCGEEAWAADGGAIFFLAGKHEGEGAGPLLWRADAATGAAEPLSAEGSFARAPLALPGGAVRFFLAQLVRDAGGATTGATFTPAELPAPAAPPAPLAPPFDASLDLALWAPDGSGVAVEVSTGERSALRWIAIGGQPVDLPNADAPVTRLVWGGK